MELSEAIGYLKEYSGRALKLMEVCGTHTAGIRKNGIPSMLSGRIELVTGPGCPVCVTVSSYIDFLIRLSGDDHNVIVSFADMLRVPGSASSLNNAKAEGADIRYVYSPMDMLKMAAEDRERTYIFAAAGFETTAPVYAALIQEAEEEGIDNIRLLTSLKTMPAAIRRVAAGIDGFLAPGHVAVITGTEEYEALASGLGVPFAVSGFSAEELIASIYALVRMAEKREKKCVNLYPRAVASGGNEKARSLMEEYFESDDAAWRGLGIIPGSGLYLKKEYERFDASSREIMKDDLPSGCRCGEVISGRIHPEDCPLFKTSCTPDSPVGACMVSQEGACFNHYEG